MASADVRWALGACPGILSGRVRSAVEPDARRRDDAMGIHRRGAATTQTAPRRPNPAGAWGLRADTASLVVDDGSPSSPPRSLSAPRKPHARGPTQYPDRLLDACLDRLRGQGVHVRHTHEDPG